MGTKDKKTGIAYWYKYKHMLVTPEEYKRLIEEERKAKEKEKDPHNTDTKGGNDD